MSNEISIGLVCEGKTDFEILARTLIKSIESNGFDCSITPLQPSRDATSGSYGEGGWRQVYQWCVRNPPSNRSRYFSNESLFEGINQAGFDLILVQIDGDICDELKNGKYYNDLGIPRPGKAGVDIRNDVDLLRQYIICIVNTWLKNPATASKNADLCLPVPTIVAIESWILGSCSDIRDIEKIPDPKKEVGILWHKMKKRRLPKKFERMKSPLDRYVWIFDNSKINLDSLVKNSVCYKKSIAEILEVIK